jgi:hypothetical protein
MNQEPKTNPIILERAQTMQQVITLSPPLNPLPKGGEAGPLSLWERAGEREKGT